MACWRNYDAHSGGDVSRGAGTRRARRGGGPPPPPTDRARSRSSRAREPFRARRSPSGAIVALARPRVASRTTSTLTPKPEPVVGRLHVLKSERVPGSAPAVDCRRFTAHDARGASVEDARVYSRAGSPTAWTVAGGSGLARGLARGSPPKWIDPAQKSTASGSSPPKTAPLR